MRDRKQKDPYSSPSAPDDERPRLIDEARALYTRYAGQATRTIIESHKEAARAKPAWLKALNIIGVALVIVAALVLAFGALKWPDAPIRQTPRGFIGKKGLPHTREDYELFELWKRWLFVTFPLAFVVNIVTALIEKRKYKRGGAVTSGVKHLP